MTSRQAGHCLGRQFGVERVIKLGTATQRLVIVLARPADAPAEKVETIRGGLEEDLLRGVRFVHYGRDAVQDGIAEVIGLEQGVEAAVSR